MYLSVWGVRLWVSVSVKEYVSLCVYQEDGFWGCAAFREYGDESRESS